MIPQTTWKITLCLDVGILQLRLLLKKETFIFSFKSNMWFHDALFTVIFYDTLFTVIFYDTFFTNLPELPVRNGNIFGCNVEIFTDNDLGKVHPGIL